MNDHENDRGGYVSGHDRDHVHHGCGCGCDRVHGRDRGRDRGHGHGCNHDHDRGDDERDHGSSEYVNGRMVEEKGTGRQTVLEKACEG